MKKYLLKASGIAMAVLISTSLFAQEAKEKEKSKNKMGDHDEVIIITKTNKDAKVTVEVKDGEVTVNGKPIDDFKDDDISVRRSRSLLNGARAYTVSPFRGGQTWNYDGFMDMKDRAYLGVTTEKNDKGARITDVGEKTAAGKAGLKEGDIITRVGETKIEDHDDLTTAIRKHKPEEKVAITYLREGKERSETVTLGKTSGSYSITTAPRMQGLADLEPSFDFKSDFGQGFSYFGRPRLGIHAQDTEDGKGVKVLSVDDESPAEKAGIKDGDIITEFDGKETNSADQLAEAARATKDKSSMSVKLRRNGSAQTVEVKIPKKLKTANL
ncbi:MAG: PDZ domain-containing protein [Chitinophagaceae bacterium]